MKIETTLKKHHVRPTKIRTTVYSIFANRSHALSHADIELEIGSEFDRVTIYRTLNTFEENGLLHKVVDDSGIAKFALCDHGQCSTDVHQDEHLHFQCRSCGHLFCLENIQIPDLHLPEGYETHSVSLKAEGLCSRCKK